MNRVTDSFAEMVFSDQVMRERLPKAVYRAIVRTTRDGTPLDAQIADTVANAMRDWAVEKGATHYTHWFQPMTGITAEKHDAFITPLDGKAIMEFSGKERMPAASPPAASGPPSKPVGIRPGTLPAMPLSRMTPCAFPRPSAPIRGKSWTRRHRFCAPWRPCPARRCASSGSSAGT